MSTLKHSDRGGMAMIDPGPSLSVFPRSVLCRKILEWLAYNNK